jgi:hypothetical protein
LCAIESVSGFEGRRKGATGSFLALNCGNDHGELENVHARFDARFFLGRAELRTRPCSNSSAHAKVILVVFITPR